MATPRTGHQPRPRTLAESRRSGRWSGPVVIGYDGSPAADVAVAHAADVLRAEVVLVVVVWEAGRAYEAAEWAAITLDSPAPAVDLRTAAELDQAVYAGAQRAALRGAATVRSRGLPAEALVVADEMSVADTLIRIARERDASVLVIGARHHGTLSEVLLGSTEHDVIHHSPCPVLVVREDTDRDPHEPGSPRAAQ